MKKVILASFILSTFVLAGCSQADQVKITGEVVKEFTKCIDSDNGNNIEEKGTVNDELTDKCMAGLLIEYYCEDNKPVNQNHRCLNKCVDGACV